MNREWSIGIISCFLATVACVPTWFLVLYLDGINFLGYLESVTGSIFVPTVVIVLGIVMYIVIFPWLICWIEKQLLANNVYKGKWTKIAMPREANIAIVSLLLAIVAGLPIWYLLFCLDQKEFLVYLAEVSSPIVAVSFFVIGMCIFMAVSYWFTCWIETKLLSSNFLKDRNSTESESAY